MQKPDHIKIASYGPVVVVDDQHTVYWEIFEVK